MCERSSLGLAFPVHNRSCQLGFFTPRFVKPYPAPLLFLEYTGLNVLALPTIADRPKDNWPVSVYLSLV